MPSRRSHFKSRHGCKECKAAHVKCDFGRPICGRCMRRGKSCEFASPDTPSIVNTKKSPGHLQYPGQTIIASKVQSLEVNTLSWDDLELLHHFSTVTYITLANREDLHQMWRVQVPKLAMKHRFLMHSIFSVAALHIAFLQPENASIYIDKATRHNNIALREFRSKLCSMTPENNPSLFACSTLLVLVALGLAGSGPHQESRGAIVEIAGIFVLTQGVRLVLEGMWNWVQESEIAPLLVVRKLDDNITLPEDVAVAIGVLEEFNQQSTDPPSVKEAYALAIQELKVYFKHLQLERRENGVVLSWAVKVSQDYTKLLSLRRPMALVILAYFAVILDEIRDTWWAKGWGTQLVQEVSQMLSDEWKGLMSWPIDKISIRSSHE